MASVRQSFTTHNRMSPEERIDLALVDGPFRHLAGSWLFTPLGEQGCKVVLELEFDFSSRVLEATIGPIFNQICLTMIDAFAKRADQIYPSK